MKKLFLWGCLFLLCSQAHAEIFPSKKLGLIFKNQTVYINTAVQPDMFQSQEGPHLQLTPQGVFQLRLAHEQFKQGFSFWNWHFAPAEKNKTWVYTDAQTVKSFLKKSSLLDESEKKEAVTIRHDQENQWIITGKPYEGFLVDTDQLTTHINTAIWTGQKTVEVPFRHYFSRPNVAKEIQEKYRIHEIIAMGKSNFSGSSPQRIHNIKLGAEKINGTLVRKGKNFSFNDVIKSITSADGFQSERVIKGNTTVQEAGGGVCEVSTAIFRAAFWGGLPITERYNHSLALDNYQPYGLDAAIYIGSKDLRFQNDTPGDILIQAFTDNNNIYFTLYGVKDNRLVSAEGPFVSNVRPPREYLLTKTGEPQLGFQTQWIRKIEKEGHIEEEEFSSLYRPWVMEPSEKKLSSLQIQ